MNRYVVLSIVFCIWLVPSAPGQTPDKPVEQPAEEFVIGLQDVLAVFVWREPELSVKEVVVRPDGKISLPLVNDIQAAGFTTKQLQDSIAGKLKEFVATPTVTVSIVKMMSQTVSLVGEVGKPGVYTLGSPTTVLDLLAKSGGFREEAKTKRIKIVRKEGDKTLQFDFNYKDVSQGKKLEQNIRLKNGDVVIVP